MVYKLIVVKCLLVSPQQHKQCLNTFMWLVSITLLFKKSKIFSTLRPYGATFYKFSNIYI